MDRYIGKKLEGRYEILELIGFGGMAIVFKAFDRLENKYVAVKILKDEFLQNDDFKRRFRNESKAIALLSHPGIVKVSDVNFSDNIQYIVMEYIDGITLKEYIEQQGSVRWKEAVHFTVQILRALQHAHDNGIVHRDVKPQNVMLLEDGTIKVMDFGIARFARENGKTLSDKAIGSVHYISPEQAQGDNTDERTDIYAVGVILYEMLTGKVPFDGDTPVSIAIKQMQQEPQRPTLLKADIPIGLEEIILRAMQKDPQLRYQTAAEMLRDIDEFKHNPTVVFEYKYFNKDGTTKYFNKIDSHNTPAAAIMEEPKKRSYTMNILAGVTAACVILAGIAIYFFIKGINNTPDTVKVVNFVGMTVAQAQKAAPDLNFEVILEQPSPDYNKGVIIDQKPKADTIIKVKNTIEITVSSGLEALIMPDLVNEALKVAKSRLVSMGITNVEVAQKLDPTIPEGQVIQTDPAANTELKKTDNVVLYVSLGVADEPIRVPTLLGRTEIEARNELAKANLIIGKVIQVDSVEPKGIVVTQSILPDTKVEKGTAVDIEISNGSGEPGIPGTPGVPGDGTVHPVAINIPFPSGADDEDFTFQISVNGIQIQTLTINPATHATLWAEFTLSDGLINDFVSVGSTNQVTIILPNGLFAEYSLDFSTGIATAVIQPDYNLIFSDGRYMQ